MDARKLALTLARSESEADVIVILKNAGLWNDDSAWRFYGDKENNFADIGNQQSRPEAALVEKITNSVDAVLMRECLARGINPEGPDAPRTIQEALQAFFNIRDGRLSNLDPRTRSKLAENICVVATGQKTNPCYAVVDTGEGQTPHMLPETILSLGKSNKLRIPFVQGKFNMGGTGVLQFCGRRNLQLVISRRHPSIPRDFSDPTWDLWGVTVVRREDPQRGMRNSVFRYLAPQGAILTFDAPFLPLLPDEENRAYVRELEAGTFIKLYEYDMQGLKTNILFDLYNRLSLLMPQIALPIRLYERRGYESHSRQTTLSGLSVRLDEDRRENLEDGFPTYHEFQVMGQRLKTHVYAFRRDASAKYKRGEGIIFTIHGQTHGALRQEFFSRKNVGMGYLEDSILVLVDCSEIDGRIREDTFMNSRDRLRENSFRSNVERLLEQLICEHPGLRELRARRRLEATREQMADSRPLAKALERILRKSPTFAALFIHGDRLPNPFDLKQTSSQQRPYEGKRFPTFFTLERRYTENHPKNCPTNVRCRIQYKTDAANDYFGRETEPGVFRLYLGDEPYESHDAPNLWNGTAYLNLRLPSDASPGETLYFRSEVSDPSRVAPFEDEFYVHVLTPVEKTSGTPGLRRDPAGNDAKGDNKEPSGLSLPPIIEVRRDRWEEFGFDRESALRVVSSGDDGYDFYVNMDNVYLLTEQKGDTAETEILNARFKFGMALIGLAMLRQDEGVDRLTDDECDNGDAFSSIERVTRQMSPILLPMISCLSTLADEMAGTANTEEDQAASGTPTSRTPRHTGATARGQSRLELDEDD